MRAGEECARRLGEARRLYTTPDSVEDLEAIRRRARRRAPDAVRHLLRDRAGARLRPRAPRPRRPADPRLRRRPRRPRPVRPRRLPRDGPEPAGLCPARCRGVSRAPIGLVAKLAARLRARAAARRSPTTAAAAATRSGSARPRSPTCCYDSDYNPPLRARVPAAVHAALRGDTAPLARLLAEGDGLAELPSPKSFSSARYATVCEETPLPWDASTPLGDRLGEAQRRAAEIGPAAFFPFDLRPPRPTRSASACTGRACRPGAYRRPRRPIRPCRRCCCRAARTCARRPRAPRTSRRRSRAPSAWPCPASATRSSAATRAAAACAALERFVAGEPAGRDCRRVGTGVPGDGAAAARAAPRRAAARAARARGAHGGGVGVTVDDLAFSLSPAFLAYSGGGLRGGSFAVRRGRVIVRRFSAVRGMWISGVARRGVLRLRIGGRAAAHGRVIMRSGGRLSGRLGGRRDPRPAAGLRGREPRARGSRAPGRDAGGRVPRALSSRSRHARVWFRHPRR